MTQKNSSVSTQDVRTAHYKKASSFRNRRARLSSNQGPSSSEPKPAIPIQYPEPSSVTYPRNDSATFNRTDVKRKSAIRTLQKMVRRYLGFNVKGKQPERPVNGVPVLPPYQPLPNQRTGSHDYERTRLLRRESSLRTSIRPPSRTAAAKARWNSSEVLTAQENLISGDGDTNDIAAQSKPNVEGGLRRNNSLSSQRLKRLQHLVSSESAPEAIQGKVDGNSSSCSLRNRSTNTSINHTSTASAAVTAATVVTDDAESGFDSPTDSKIFFPPMPCLKGLPNLGNTCYMNSILHCLSATDLLAEYFITNAFLRDLRVKATNGEFTDSVAVVFKRVLEALWYNEPTLQCIQDFCAIIARHNSVYATSSQQDAQELLDWLLDKLHEELDAPAFWDYDITEQHCDGSPSRSLHRKVHRSAITNIFSASFRSSIECSSCAFKTVNYDPFICVSLQVPEQEQSVFVMLAEVTKPRRLLRFGMKVEEEGRIYDVKDCIRNEFNIQRNLLGVIELGSSGFTLLPSSSKVVKLNTESLFALEIVPPRIDDITIIFAVVDSTAVNDRGQDQDIRVTEPFFCLVPRHATYDHICNSLFNAIRRTGSGNFEIKFPDDRLSRLVIYDRCRCFPTLDRGVSMPLYTQPVEDALLEVREEAGSALVLQLLFKTRDTTFLRYLRNDQRYIEDHGSYNVLRDLGTFTTLTDCLKEYTRPELLDWTCSMCGRNGGKKIMKFHSLPDVLVFHLKRFRRLKNGKMVKLSRKIDFPTSGLDMSQFIYQKLRDEADVATYAPSRYANNIGVPVFPQCLPHQDHQPRSTADAIFVDTTGSNQYIYDLFAIVHHMGTSIDSGHYTATTKNPMDLKWRHYDDLVVRDVNSPNETETNTVYLLFYEKRSAKRRMNCTSSGHSSTESGIQEHWFNRKVVDLSIKSKRSSFHGTQIGNDNTRKMLPNRNEPISASVRESRSNDNASAVNFQYAAVPRNLHSPVFYVPHPHLQNVKGRGGHLSKNSSIEQNVLC